jgi:hypothetical protein
MDFHGTVAVADQVVETVVHPDVDCNLWHDESFLWRLSWRRTEYNKRPGQTRCSSGSSHFTRTSERDGQEGTAYLISASDGGTDRDVGWRPINALALAFTASENRV